MDQEDLNIDVTLHPVVVEVTINLGDRAAVVESADYLEKVYHDFKNFEQVGSCFLGFWIRLVIELFLNLHLPPSKMCYCC